MNKKTRYRQKGTWEGGLSAATQKLLALKKTEHINSLGGSISKLSENSYSSIHNVHARGINF